MEQPGPSASIEGDHVTHRRRVEQPINETTLYEPDLSSPGAHFEGIHSSDMVAQLKSFISSLIGSEMNQLNNSMAQAALGYYWAGRDN